MAVDGSQSRIPRMDCPRPSIPWPGNPNKTLTGSSNHNPMKPKYLKSKLTNVSGILLASSITLCLSGGAAAADLTFNGAANDGNWNNTANWTTGVIPGAGDNAAINHGTNAGPNITTAVGEVSQFWVGTGAGNSGSVTLATGGTVTAGAWTVVGREGGSGTLTQSGGTFNQNGRSFIIGSNNGSVGIFNQSGGTVNIAAGAEEFRIAESTGSTGTVTSSGTINLVKNAVFGPGTAAFTLNAGGTFAISGNTNGNGELQIGQGGTGIGTFTQNGGTVTVNNWVSVGRGGGQGTFNLNGGSFTKSANGSFLVGDGTKGTMTQTGGTLTLASGDFKIGAGGSNTTTASVTCSAGLTDVQVGRTQVGENGSPLATMDLSGSAEHRTNAMIIGAANTTGTFGANGGTLRMTSMAGGDSIANVTFNGTQIIAKADASPFISNLDTAEIQSGGLLIDSNGFNLSVPQIFSGSGNIVKSGAGTLNLGGSGNSPHTGNVLVNAGTVAIGNADVGSTDFTLANNAGLTVNAQDDFTTRSIGTLTLGTSGATSLSFNFGNFSGNPFSPAVSATSLVVNGTVTVNVADDNIILGSIPLLQYTSKTGSGNFVIGTLPVGVIANVVDNGSGLVSLNVTGLSQPRWDATFTDIWNTTTSNWTNGGNPSTYTNGSITQFDDTVTGLTQGAVVLNTTVTPLALTFDNSLVPYSLSGTGSISGTTGLVKKGSETLVLGTVNGYTGVTDLQAGSTSISSIANAGSPSAIGAASASPANLLFSGGSLSYTGTAASTDRGFTLAAVDSSLSTDSDLTITGEVAATGSSNLIKDGSGNLILSGTANKTIGTVNKGLRVNGGGVIFNGSGTNTVAGEIWLGDPLSTGNTTLQVTNSNLTSASWLAVGIANGTTGLSSDVTFTNSTVTQNGGGISLGYSNGLFNFLGNSSLTLNASTVNTADFELGRSTGSTAVCTLNGASVMNATGNLLIGRESAVGTLELKDTSAYTSGGNVFIGAEGGSNGTMQIGGSASFTIPADREFQLGSSGTGAMNLTAGTVSGNGWMSIGRNSGGTGTLSVSGGTFTQAAADRFMHVGEAGIGTLTISGTGSFVAASTTGLLLGDSAASQGTVNLDGGTLTATAVLDAASGTTAFHFNGGLLQAATGANATFMNGIDTVTVKSSGARIDSNGNNITVNSALLAGTGNGGLIKSGAGILTLAGANTYSGNTAVNAGALTLADNGQLRFVIGANGVNNAVTGSGTVQLDGDFAIDTTAANTTSGNTWSLVHVGTLSASYGGTFNVVGFTNSSGVWTKTEGPNTWTYTQSTGVLSVSAGAGGYAAWAAANAGGQAPDLDFDSDGVENGVEFFMGQTGSGFTANPTVTGGQITWPKSAGFSGTYRVETSPNLTTWTDVTSAAVDNGSSVSYTLPTGNTKLFVHLVVIPN
jgi:autotransporter-associated beta strand protein/T5SS/PEP-CTERM-associated repeat protein